MSYHWHNIGDPGGGWRIDEGISRALIAEGSGYSRSIGLALFHMLTIGERFGVPRVSLHLVDETLPLETRALTNHK